MRENTVKRAWRDGKLTYGAWLSIPSSFSAEVMAHQGFDYVCVDMQHGVIGYQTAVTMLQAISTTPVTPFVRVPWNEPGIIGKMLQAGARGGGPATGRPPPLPPFRRGVAAVEVEHAALVRLGRVDEDVRRAQRG